MSVYNNSDVKIQGYSSTVIAGDQNVQNIHVTSAELRSAFEKLQDHVATNALYNSGEVSALPKCHPGTRVAIIDHLIAWATALTYTYPIVWLHGPAGAGKSAIQRTIAQLLSNQGLLLASFFFFRTSARRNNSTNFIATVAYQLALAIPSTRSHIESAINRNPVILSLSLWAQAQALIISPIHAAIDDPSFDANQCPRIAIIDGLDECQDPDKQSEILDVLRRIIQDLPIPLAIVIASRPEHHIRGAFDLGDLNRCSSRLSLDDSYNPDADIEKFLIDNFSKIREHHPFRAYLSASWPSQRDVDNLVTKASGQFIYASTVVRFVSSIRHRPAERLDVLLGNLEVGTLKPFEELDSLYSTIFHAIDQTDLAGALRVLGAVMVLSLDDTYHRSYSPQFFEHLLELGTGGVRQLLFDLESLLTIDSDDKEIRFFHASLPDYLFDKSRSGQFWIEAGIVYADISQQCLLQLSSSACNDDVVFFYDKQGRAIFSQATPTADLYNTIKNFDITKVRSSQYFDLRPMLLYVIRHSKFPDAEQLYHPQLVLYARVIQPKIQLYLQDTRLYYAFITTYISHSPFTEWRTALQHIFHLSPAMVEDDKHQGLRLLAGLQDTFLISALKDILENPQGEYFIDKHQYAEIALYLMKFMCSAPVSYPYPALLAVLCNSFPVILSRTPLRHYIMKYIQSIQLDPFYLTDTSISDAIMTYTSRARALLALKKKNLDCLDHEEPRFMQSGVRENQGSGSTTRKLSRFRAQPALSQARSIPNVEKPSVIKYLLALLCGGFRSSD